MSWVADSLIGSILSWFAKLIVDGLNVLWDLLSASVFVSPDVTVLPQVRTFSATSLGVVNTAYVLAILSVSDHCAASGVRRRESHSGSCLTATMNMWWLRLSRVEPA